MLCIIDHNVVLLLLDAKTLPVYLYAWFFFLDANTLFFLIRMFFLLLFFNPFNVDAIMDHNVILLDAVTLFFMRGSSSA